MEMAEKLGGLKKSIESAERRKAEEKRRELAREEREESANRKFWGEEGKKLDEKLKLAEDIFRWGRGFSRSEEYRRLLDILSDDSLWFYGGGWGHERSGDNGRWSRLYLRRDGTLYYWAGYKWMPCGPEWIFRTPRELAKRLTKNYLKELHRFIATGRVYERLREEVSEALDET